MLEPRGEATRISNYPHQVCGVAGMPPARLTLILTGEREEVRMHGYADGWDWFWMSFMMGFWIVLIGVVVYVAVRLAQQPRRERKQ
jgi:hypothetical protein